MKDEVFTIRARRCKRCGRILTSKESVEKGFGCQCAAKEKAEEAALEPIPGQISMFDLQKDFGMED